MFLKYKQLFSFFLFFFLGNIIFGGVVIPSNSQYDIFDPDTPYDGEYISSPTAFRDTITWKSDTEDDINLDKNWEQQEGTGHINFNVDFLRYDVIFSKSNTLGSAVIITNKYVNFNSLKFDSPTSAGFNIKDGSGNSEIRFHSVTNPTTLVTKQKINEPHTYIIEPSINLKSDVIADIATNDTIYLSNITGNKSLTLFGNSKPNQIINSSKLALAGNIYLSGTNTFSGNLICSNAVLRISGQLGETNDESSAYFYSAKKDTDGISYGNTIFCGGTFNKNIINKNAGLGTTILNQNTSIVFDKNSTNILNRKFTSVNSCQFTFLENSKTYFNNDIICNNSIVFNSTSERKSHVVIFNGNIICKSDVKGVINITGSDYNSEYIFNSSGSELGMYLSCGSRNKKLICNTDYPIKIGTGYYMSMGSDTNIDRYGKCNLILNGTKYSVPNMKFSAGATVIGTKSGSQFEITEGSSDSSKCYCRGNFVGYMNLLMKGTDLVQLNNDDSISKNTATGDITVVSGTLEIGSTSSWKNGINFTVMTNGVLKFAKSDQINHKIAKFHFIDGGKIYIPEGVIMKVRSVSIKDDKNDTELDGGIYDSSHILLTDKIIGGGSIQVSPNVMFIIK